MWVQGQKEGQTATGNFLKLVYFNYSFRVYTTIIAHRILHWYDLSYANYPSIKLIRQKQKKTTNGGIIETIK